MNELQHYGIKGMRWGVRKSRQPISQDKRLKNIKRKESVKKVLKIAGITVVSAGALYLANKSSVDNFVASFGKKSIFSVTSNLSAEQLNRIKKIQRDLNPYEYL